MNKKILLGISGFVVLFILITIFVFARKPSLTTSPTPTSTESQSQAKSQTQPQSLKEILSAGISQKCSYDFELEGNSSRGEVYISDSKIRADFVTVTTDKSTNTHMILDNNLYYLWVDGQVNGFKMSFDPNAVSSDQSPTSNQIDWDQKLSYNCSPWIADQSKFVLPSNITFQELSTKANCALCDQLTGEDKSQCLTSLGCN